MSHITRVVLNEEPFPSNQDSSTWNGGRLDAKFVKHPNSKARPFFAVYSLTLNLDKPIKARIHVTADERYQLFVNGQLGGRGSERGDEEHWFFESYDLDLQIGEHRLSAWVWSLGDVHAPYAQVMVQHGFLCISDDHEYWNNFPYPQAQLNNTHSKNDRKNWKDLADLLYQRYQMTPGQQDGFFRMDIEPLYMLFIDGRRFRDEGKEMFNAASWSAIEQWTKDLLQLKKSSKSPVVGLLSSGQALLMEKSNSLSSHVLDAEMPNFPDHEKLISKISQLINAGIPIIYITGDVHWGRIVEGKDSANNTMFYEIIASPLSISVENFPGISV